jgi:hypothetical protein
MYGLGDFQPLGYFCFASSSVTAGRMMTSSPFFQFTGGLGFQPSFSVGRLFSRYAALQQVCRLVYAALPLEVSVLYGWHRMNRRRLSANILMLCLGSNVAGYLLYYCFPAAGPVYAFGKLFPWRPPELSSLLIQTVQIPVAPRNAMPSVHVAAALLVFWNSIAWPKWARAVTGLFLLLTILATLGFGEHYLVDAVVAMPFSLALQAAATTALPWKSPARKNALIGGALAVGIWLVLLRTGAPVFRMSAAIAWSAVAGTVILCLVLRRRLLRSANLSQCDAFAASCKL